MRKTADRLLELISSKPKNKYLLAEMLNCSERDIREAVHELRNRGINIVSNSQNKGYWLGTEEDKEKTIRELRSRANSLLKTACALEKGEDIGQMVMKEVDDERI